MIRVLFVCLGNICRSPTAHSVFAKKVQEAVLSDQIMVDSAGSSGWHNGKMPDSRAIEYAMRRGYDLSGLRSRQITETDFEHFDYILAMDHDNLRDLRQLSPEQHKHKVKLFLEFAELITLEVPDPYYGGDEGFEQALTLIEQGSDSLLAYLKQGC